MSDINISLSAGDKKRLLTGGKYCPDDIVVEAVGGGDTDAAFEAGRKAEYDAFWDAYQNHGEPMDYYCAFGRLKWTAETYNPKYPIICGYTTESGRQLYDTNTIITDTKVPITILGPSALRTFGGATALTTIRELNLHEGVVLDRTFVGCRNLKDLTISGKIGKTIDLQYSSLLTKASVVSVITALSVDASAQTATFSEQAINKAFETSEGANDGTTSAEWLALVATKSNWTISLV